MSYHNEGTLDRTIRIAIGAILLFIAITIRHSGWAYIGFIPLITGTIGYCPIYRLFGISTYEAWNRDASDAWEM